MIIFCCGLFGLGLYFIFADVFQLPTITKTLSINYVLKKNKPAFSLDMLINNYSNKLAPYIKLSPYKRKRMQIEINTANLQQTPEEYVASAIAKSGIFIILSIISLFFFPILTPIFLTFSITIFLTEIKKASRLSNQKKENIESELPRFASTISQELHSTHNVKTILKKYKNTTNPTLQKEISITLADMSSGNEETALIRFQSRIGSSLLSEIIRGLIAVIRGDDGIAYFEMLSHDLKKVELQKLKREAIKRPGKMKKYSFSMLLCLILTYLVVMGYEIYNSFGKMF